MAIGIGYEDFWNANPHIINIYIEAHKKQMEIQDEQNWVLGMYVMRAVEVAIDHCLRGKKSKAEYLDKPIFKEVEEKQIPTTEEEKKAKTEQLFNMLRIMQTNFNNSND